MTDQFIPTTSSWLLENTNWGSGQRNAMATLCRKLVGFLTVAKTGSVPVVVSISGAPGSGKSTLARLLAAIMISSGNRCQTVSLDDYYLSRRQRLALAKHIHPLCAVRGVPGTHELPMLLENLDCLITGDVSSLKMPQFDKVQDDRLVTTGGCDVEAPLDYIFLEGWMLGSRPQKDKDLEPPTNSVEAEQDADLVWRKWSNEQHKNYARALGKRTDLTWYLRVPDWNSVVDWRWQQEQELTTAALKTREHIRSFLAHFQRLVQHMQVSCTDWADIVIPLDRSHCASLLDNTRIYKENED